VVNSSLPVVAAAAASASEIVPAVSSLAANASVASEMKDEFKDEFKALELLPTWEAADLRKGALDDKLREYRDDFFEANRFILTKDSLFDASYVEPLTDMTHEIFFRTNATDGGLF